MTRTRKPPRGFMDGYRTYADTEDTGDPGQWRSAFAARMSFDEARRVVGDDSPLGILGLAAGATWQEIKTAYRKLARRYHPDVCLEPGAEERMKKINGAYLILERQHV